MEAPKIYVPNAIYPSIQNILQEYAKIEQYEMKYQLHPLKIHEQFLLENNYFCEAIEAYHRIPAYGYIIFEKRNKLNPKFINLKPQKLREIKKNPDSKEYRETFFEQMVPYITYSGDTKIEFVTKNKVVQKSKILFLECTFINSVRTIEQARYWGHIHLDEIVQKAELFRSIERLFLIHISPRYSKGEIARCLKNTLPSWLYEKTQAVCLL